MPHWCCTAETPRISSAADASTFAFGTTTAEQRNTTVAVQNGPLRTAGLGTGGAVAIDPNFAFSAANTGASSVAKRIVNDMGDNREYSTATSLPRPACTVLIGMDVHAMCCRQDTAEYRKCTYYFKQQPP